MSLKTSLKGLLTSEPTDAFEQELNLVEPELAFMELDDLISLRDDARFKLQDSFNEQYSQLNRIITLAEETQNFVLIDVAKDCLKTLNEFLYDTYLVGDA